MMLERILEAMDEDELLAVGIALLAAVLVVWPIVLVLIVTGVLR